MRLALFFASVFLTFAAVHTGDIMSAQSDSPAAAATQALVLDAGPPAPSETLATLDILSEQTLLGPDDERFAVREGQVTVGTPLLYALKMPTPERARLLALRGAEQSSFYLIVFRFTLQPAPGERRYRSMSFKVALSDPRSTAFKLFPERVVSEEDVKQGFDIGFVLSLGNEKSGSPVTAEVKGEATQMIELTRQIPEITAFGGGESLFYWQFKGGGDMPLAPGTRTAAAIIQVPKGTKQLNASIAWDVNLERSRFEEWFKVPTRIDALPVELPLL